MLVPAVGEDVTISIGAGSTHAQFRGDRDPLAHPLVIDGMDAAIAAAHHLLSGVDTGVPIDLDAVAQVGGKSEPLVRQIRAAASGSAIHPLRCQDQGLVGAAFAGADQVAAVFLNENPELRFAVLDLGRREGGLCVWRTDAEHDCAPISRGAYTGRPISIALTGRSITTYALHLGVSTRRFGDGRARR